MSGVMNWLDPLRKTLDSAPDNVRFFFRNDDAGWNDTRLFELLQTFAENNIPIDLAVIPTSISQPAATRLRTTIEADPDRVSLHQHGYAHLNHEATGRKCEFGETRPRDLQLADLKAGQHLLKDLFGPAVDSFFTPPWNRCTTTTAACLRQAGFTLLSRDTTAQKLNTDGLAELPISVDWFAKRKGVPLTPTEIGAVLSAAAASTQTSVGVMLHHALMDQEERVRLGELLSLLSAHSQARCVLMRDLRSTTRGETS